MSKDKLDSYSSYYTANNLQIDDLLIEAAFDEFKKFFRGRDCLELGPANGLMTQHLRHSFKSLDLVEGAESLLRAIPEYDNVTKHHSIFADFKPTKSYDTIVMNHVLEHLESPVDELKNIRNWLKEDGVFICGVPNANSYHRLLAVEMGLLEASNELNDRDKALGHYRVYTLDELIKDVEQAGFRVISSGGIGLKFLSNSQLKDLFSEDFIKAALKMGSLAPNHGAEVFVICKKNIR